MGHARNGTEFDSFLVLQSYPLGSACASSSLVDRENFALYDFALRFAVPSVERVEVRILGCCSVQDCGNGGCVKLCCTDDCIFGAAMEKAGPAG